MRDEANVWGRRDLSSIPIDQIRPEDLNGLIGLSETEVLEFKRRPSGSSGDEEGQDGWSLSNKARDSLLKEIVALANGYGGQLIVGIAESGTRPPRRAEKVDPLPSCADLAERLQNFIRDCVDPRIPILQIRAVQIGDGDGGIVICRVPQSRLAPHAVKANGRRAAYRRHGASSEPMTMREIQDLTISRLRHSDSIESVFESRLQDFLDRCQASTFDSGGGLHTSIGIGAVLIPVAGTPAFDDFHALDLKPWDSAQRGLIGSLPFLSLAHPGVMFHRPILRGLRYHGEGNGCQFRHEMREDGSVTYDVVLLDESSFAVPARKVMFVACNALLSCDRLRLLGGIPDAEYSFQLLIVARKATGQEIRIGSDTPLLLRDYLSTVIAEFAGHGFDATTIMFPRYSVGDRDSLQDTLELVHEDLFRAAGAEPRAEFQMVVPPRDRVSK